MWLCCVLKMFNLPCFQKHLFLQKEAFLKNVPLVSTCLLDGLSLWSTYPEKPAQIFQKPGLSLWSTSILVSFLMFFLFFYFSRPLLLLRLLLLLFLLLLLLLIFPVVIFHLLLHHHHICFLSFFLYFSSFFCFFDLEAKLLRKRKKETR